jgi:hypothetical protein
MSISRFESKINKERNGCWLWTGTITKRGYGQFKLNGKMASAHRVSYELTFGKIAENLHVRHKCRNTACVNPDHLELGTREDNMSDKLRDGTDARGSKHGQAKLTETDVIELRAIKDMFTLSELSEMYGLQKASIYSIISNRTWKHLL